jgi:hypothetical protein
LLALADKIAIRAALSAVHEVMLIAQSILIIFFDPNFFSSGVFGPTLRYSWCIYVAGVGKTT